MTTVFHVITTINRGGAENQLLVLAKQQVKLGIDVHIVYLKGDPELELDFLEIGTSIHCEVARKPLLLQGFALRKLINSRDYVVHAHLPRAELFSLFIPKKNTLICTRHNSEPFFPGKPKIISNFLSRIVEIRSSKIIAISRAVQDFLLERKEIRHSSSIEVILYGYEPRFTKLERNAKTKCGVNSIGTISRLANQKDIPTMLTSFQKFRMNNPEAHLSILGAGPMEIQLKDLVIKMKLDPFVSFLGRSSDIYSFLSSLDAFILTSKYEGFGMVLLEAMDVGVPIVAARNSAIPEVLGTNFLGLCETGNADDFAQKIAALNSPKHRNSILILQEERLNIFNAKEMAQKVNRLYLPDFQ